MRKNFKKPILATLLATSLVFCLTACSNEQGSSAPATSSDAEQNASEETKSESAVITDESVLKDGKLASNAWKDGVLKINGKIFALTKTTLEQFTESGYTADEADMNYIIYGSHSVPLSDEKHQKTEIKVKNYSNDKPLYCKHALVSGYTVNFAVDNGLEGADAILPGNIKGGMTKDEIIKIVGSPKEDNYDTSLSYEYEENNKGLYTITFHFDYDTHTLTDVNYSSYMDFANVADDSSTIQSSLDTTSSSLTGKSNPSDILKDAEIKIGSNVYTMPISMTDLTELGYSMHEDRMDIILNPKEEDESTVELIDKGGNIMNSKCFFNPLDKPCSRSNCLVTELSFNSKAENVSIAKGIKIGSTYNEVCDAFGKTKKLEVESGTIIIKKDESAYCLNYTYSAKRGEVETTFFFSKKDDKVCQIDMSVKELTQD